MNPTRWSKWLARTSPVWVALLIFGAVIAIFMVGLEVDQWIDDSHPLADHILPITFVLSYAVTLYAWFKHLKSQRKAPNEK